MKKNQSSETAEFVASCRAIESMRPEKDRVIYDPYAYLLLGDKKKKQVNSTVYKLFFNLLGGLKFPGFQGSLISRVRFMNENIKECFASDYKQLVILGAGYDMSAFCFKDILINARIFEVDHVNTQEDKIAKIKKQINDIPHNITYVPVNFDTDNLKESLLSSGYVASAKTLFILEGVIYFLDDNSVGETLRFIVENSAKGSKLAFDYFPPEVIDGTCTDRLGKGMHDGVKKVGEPYKFGIKVDDIDTFLRKHHFTDIHKSSSHDVRDTYFHGTNKKRKVSHIFNFVCATT